MGEAHFWPTDKLLSRRWHALEAVLFLEMNGIDSFSRDSLSILFACVCPVRQQFALGRVHLDSFCRVHSRKWMFLRAYFDTLSPKWRIQGESNQFSSKNRCRFAFWKNVKTSLTSVQFCPAFQISPKSFFGTAGP